MCYGGFQKLSSLRETIIFEVVDMSFPYIGALRRKKASYHVLSLLYIVWMLAMDGDQGELSKIFSQEHVLFFFPPCVFCLHFFTLSPSRALLSLCLLPVFREEEAERSDKENDNSPRYLFWILKEIFVLAAVSRHVKVWAESGLVKWASPVHVVLSPFDSDVVK